MKRRSLRLLLQIAFAGAWGAGWNVLLERPLDADPVVLGVLGALFYQAVWLSVHERRPLTGLASVVFRYALAFVICTPYVVYSLYLDSTLISMILAAWWWIVGLSCLFAWRFGESQLSMWWGLASVWRARRSERAMGNTISLSEAFLQRLGAGLLFSGGALVVVAVGWPVDSEEPEQPDDAAPLGVRPAMIQLPMEMPFGMGSEEGHEDERPRHGVKLTVDFLAGETEVTQGQYAAVMGENPSESVDCSVFAGVSLVGESLPVTCVSWFDALEYANTLSLLEGLEPCYEFSGKIVGWPLGLRCEGYRLPTEAEWEYLARAGTQTDWSFGSEVLSACDHGNIADRVASETFPELDTTADCDDGAAGLSAVRSYDPSPWGLYDVHGGVWEWTWDWYAGGYEMSELDEEGHRVDPLGPGSGVVRVLRGGSWFSTAESSRSAYRNGDTPDDLRSDLGFRLVRSVVSASGDP